MTLGQPMQDPAVRRLTPAEEGALQGREDALKLSEAIALGDTPRERGRARAGGEPPQN